MYRLTFFGITINSLGELLDALCAVGDPWEEVINAKAFVEKHTPENGCFRSYEMYLEQRFPGSRVDHPDGRVAFCD